MTLAARRVQEGLGVRGWAAIAVFGAGFVVLAMALAGAARWNLGLPLLGAAVAAVGVLASIRWPLLPLYAMVGPDPDRGSRRHRTVRDAQPLHGDPVPPRLRSPATRSSDDLRDARRRLGLRHLGDAQPRLGDQPNGHARHAAGPVAALRDGADRRGGRGRAPGDRPPDALDLSLSAAVTAVIGIAEYLQGTLVAPDRISAIQGQDPAHYAALLLPALVFSLFELMNGRMVPVAGAIAFLCTLGIIVSGTRGAWVAAAVVGGLYLFPRLGPGRRILAVMLLLVLGTASLQIPGVSSLIADRADDAISWVVPAGPTSGPSGC